MVGEGDQYNTTLSSRAMRNQFSNLDVRVGFAHSYKYSSDVQVGKMDVPLEFFLSPLLPLSLPYLHKGPFIVLQYCSKAEPEPS